MGDSNYDIFLDEIKKLDGDIDVRDIGEVIDPDPNYSGAAILDAQLGIPFPEGSMAEIYGEAGTGKTTIALSILGYAQQQGKRVAYINMEKNLYKSLVDSIASIDPGAKDDDGNPWFISLKPRTGEMAFQAVELFTKSFPNSLCVIDSVDTLVPEAILEGEVGDQTIGKLGKLMSAGCRRLSDVLTKTQSSVIFINQTRLNPGQKYGDPTVRPGGKALKFYASQIIKLKNVPKANRISDDDGRVIGHKVEFEVEKNKCCPPFVEGSITIKYGAGIWEAVDLLQVAEDLALIEVKGRGRIIMPASFQQFNTKFDGQTSEFRKNIIVMLDQNPNALKVMRQLVKDRLDNG